MLNVLDLFAGCGGFSCGFLMSGKYNIVSAVEFNKDAALTYRNNHPLTTMYEKDIRELNCNDFKNIDVIIGGPPCQGFSVAGKRNTEDPRNLLPYEYIRFVKEIRPKAFVLENVKGMLSMNNGETFTDIVNNLKELDYNVSYKLLDISKYNVPQVRERIFIVGIRKDLNKTFSFPEPVNTSLTLFNAIGDIEETGSYEITNMHNHEIVTQVDTTLYHLLGEGNMLCDTRHGSMHKHSWEINLKGETTQKQKDLLNAIAENRRKKIYGHKDGNPLSIETIKELSGHTEITDELEDLLNKEYLSKIGDKYDIHDRKINMGLRIFNRNKPMNTITTQSGSNSTYAHYSQPRNLTVRELARIQTFPDNFIFYGSIKEQERQIGNAVPPILANYIAEELYKNLV